MKGYILVLTACALFFAGWLACLKAVEHRADQGYVQSDDGQVWRLKRMQVLGLGEEMVAVYVKEK